MKLEKLIENSMNLFNKYNKESYKTEQIIIPIYVESESYIKNLNDI